MGAKAVKVNLQLGNKDLDPVDSELASGKEIELKDIDFIDGFPSHQGRQIILYIKDHSWKDQIDKALADGSNGKKYHVSDCTTIKEYRENSKKRLDRYVITTNLSGDFPIAGTNQFTGEFKEGVTRLCVCKNCLKLLNYKGYSNNKKTVFSNFSLEEFFSTYSSYFSYLPNQITSSVTKEKYSNDWGVIAGNYKAEKQFKCEQCLVGLAGHKKLLHVHHKNGVKGDNSKANLIALCVDCHRKEPYHEHLFINHKDTALINKLRREQKILKTDDWAEVFEFADPSMHGLLKLCQKVGMAIPEVAHELFSDLDGIIAELELAWTQSKNCVVIRKEDAQVAQEQGWTVWPMIKAIENFVVFKNRVK